MAEIIKEPTRTTCSISSLLDHIPTNSLEETFALTKISLKTEDNVTNFDDKKKNANIFFFWGTLADDLLVDLAPPSLRFGLPSVQQYYEKSYLTLN